MIRDHPQSIQFETFSMECLHAGLHIRFQARGASMSPAIRDGETVYVKPASQGHLRCGDIVLVKDDHGFRLHRLLHADAVQNIFITRGDCGQQNDAPVLRQQILGVAVAKDVRLGKARVAARFDGAVGQLLRGLARAQAVLSKIAFATGKCRTLSQTALPKTPSANIAQSQENQFEGRSSNSAAPGEQDLRSVWRSRCAD